MHISNARSEHAVAYALRCAAWAHQHNWKLLPLARGRSKPPLEPFSITPRPPWDLVESWIRQGLNLGLDAGASRLVLVDRDEAKDPSVGEYLDGAETVRVRSPSGGTHLYFRCVRHPMAYPTVADVPRKYIDIRGWHGYCAYPGSVRPDGAYAFIHGCEPWTVDVAQCPPELDEHLARRAEQRAAKRGRTQSSKPRGAKSALVVVERWVERLRHAKPGERGNLLYRAAYAFGAHMGLGPLKDADRAERALYSLCEANGLVAADGHEAVMAQIRTSLRNGMRDAGESDE